MKKVFISQPMRDKSKEDIELERAYLIQYAREHFGNDIEIIDSYFEDFPENAKPMYFLGKAIELLSKADIAIFAKEFEKSRGCYIENMCAHKYGIDEIIEM